MLFGVHSSWIKRLRRPQTLHPNRSKHSIQIGLSLSPLPYEDLLHSPLPRCPRDRAPAEAARPTGAIPPGRAGGTGNAPPGRRHCADNPCDSQPTQQRLPALHSDQEYRGQGKIASLAPSSGPRRPRDPRDAALLLRPLHGGAEGQAAAAQGERNAPRSLTESSP